jgi:hypothetical protein
MTAIETSMEADAISHEPQLILEGSQPRHTILQLLAEWMIKALPDSQQVDRVLPVFE